MSKRAGYIVLVLVVIALLSACGGDDDETKLSETFETESGITVKYPKDWFAHDKYGFVELFNDEHHATTTISGTLPDGYARLTIMAGTWEGALATHRLDEDAPLTALVTRSARLMGPARATGDATDIRIGKHDGARINTASTGMESESFVIGFRYDKDTFVLAELVARQGNLSQYEATALDIIESVVYTAPPDENSD